MNKNQKNTLKGLYFKIIISVLFGVIGFFINFNDITIMEHFPFKINILPGLLFPLFITIAWGWRFGLLSALAGGTQTMFWLWSYWGFGLIYAGPIYTLWILWHGWWSDSQRKNKKWYKSPLFVEIPFRLFSEIAFLTVFPWLLSLNPESWNATHNIGTIPTEWFDMVLIKHTISSFLLPAVTCHFLE